MIKLFYTTYISVDLAHHEISHAKDGKGGIYTEIPHVTGAKQTMNQQQQQKNHWCIMEVDYYFHLFCLCSIDFNYLLHT